MRASEHAHGDAGLRRRLILGVGAQGFTFAAVTAQQLCLVPLFLGQWSGGLYEDWLILLAAADVLRLIDLGLNYHTANILRMAWARADLRLFGRTLKVGIGLYAILLSIAACLLLAFISIADLPAMLGATYVAPQSSSLTLILLALTTLVMLPRNFIIAIYAARGDFARGEMVNALYILIQTVATGVALSISASPFHIAVIYLATALLVGMAAIVLDQSRRYPDIDFGVAVPSRGEALDLFDKARHYSVPTLSEIVLVRAPILLLAVLAPVASAVVIFTITRTLTSVIRQIAQQISRVSGIEMSRQYAQEDLEGRKNLYEGTGWMIGGLVGLFSGLSIAVSEPFVGFWTRGKVPFDSWVFGAFLVVVFLTAPAHASAAALQYSNRPRPLAHAAVVQVVASLVLCIVLVPVVGALGAAIALGVAEYATFGLYVPVLASRELKVSVFRFLARAYGIGILMGALSYLTTMAIARFAPMRGPIDLGLLCGTSLLVMSAPALFLLCSNSQRRWIGQGLRASFQIASGLIRRKQSGLSDG
ncbi:lipopolysaccharide biosynthesis protein [Microvirga sp. P5_D2]